MIFNNIDFIETFPDDTPYGQIEAVKRRLESYEFKNQYPKEKCVSDIRYKIKEAGEYGGIFCGLIYAKTCGEILWEPKTEQLKFISYIDRNLIGY
jgi:hypothetical protein